VEIKAATPLLVTLRAKDPLAQQNDKQHDQQDEAQPAAGIISPASAIRPCWQGSDQYKNQNDEQQEAHIF